MSTEIKVGDTVRFVNPGVEMKNWRGTVLGVHRDQVWVLSNAGGPYTYTASHFVVAPEPDVVQRFEVTVTTPGEEVKRRKKLGWRPTHFESDEIIAEIVADLSDNGGRNGLFSVTVKEIP